MSYCKYFVFLLSFIFSTISYANISLTTSGGVSLGVYEAGLIYYVINEDPENLKDSDLIVTGASAGAINSFVAIIEKCSVKEDNPRNSVFWKTWIPMNYDKFFVRDNQKARSLLQRDSLEGLFTLLNTKWKEGLKKGCTATLGVTITRKNPLLYHQGAELDIARAAESVIVRITGQGNGVEPKVENVYLKDGGIQIFLPFDEKEFSSYDLLKSLLMASSSFPIAFEPSKLKHCIIEPDKPKICNKKNLRDDYFIDGGIYNNVPLNLAYNIAKDRNIHKDLTFIYFDPEIKEFPVVADKYLDENDTSIFNDLLIFIQNFISASRSGQLSSFLSSHPDLGDRLRALKGSMPLASEPLHGFFGFFEEDFRIFDFYLGMVDAKRTIHQKYVRVSDSEFQKMNKDWRWVTCIEAAYNRDREVTEKCSGDNSPTARNLKILFRVSIERLFSNCSQIENYTHLNNQLCRLATEGKGPADFYGKWDEGWKRRDFESNLEYVLRRLEHYKFHFKDLKVKPGNEKIAIVKMKNKIVKSIKKAAKSQPEEHQFVIKQFSSPFMNYLFYTPTPVENYIVFGASAIDAGRSFIFSENNIPGSYWRFGFGTMFSGLDSMYKHEVTGVGIQPYIGLYGEPSYISGPSWQYRLGVRAGYQFSTETDMKAGLCPITDRTTDDFSKCSDFVLSGVASASFIESIKLQASYSFFPLISDKTKRADYFAILFGWQF